MLIADNQNMLGAFVELEIMDNLNALKSSWQTTMYRQTFEKLIYFYWIQSVL